jgi:histidine ammonia-lyase
VDSGASSAGPLELSGESLTVADLARVARDPRVEVVLNESALGRVARCEELIRGIAAKYRRDFDSFVAGEAGAEHPISDYGVTTGFGEFKDIAIHPDDLEELPRNILLSHSTGVGDNSDADDLSNYYPADVIRAVLVQRLNTFLKGHSGVRPALVETVQRMINRGIVPLVPLHGSVGTSGDLCPLSHLFVVLLGEGRYYRVTSATEIGAGGRRDVRPATELEADLGEGYELLEPRVSYKEGLALTNGATFCSAMLALAAHDAELLVGNADIAAALGLEAMCGCARAFDPKIHEARNLGGQIDSAANLRQLLGGSRLIESRSEVQDPYSLRCAPAVHGAARDTIAYALMVAEGEINGATDNPLFFPGHDNKKHRDEPWDASFEENWSSRQGDYRGRERASYSACNFHGQPIGHAADFLAIAVAELANISERRTQMLLDRHHNRGLPANLAARRGAHSGLMLTQYAAASLVSENKVLAHPASVDSIPTGANTEDHVSMATAASRKLLRVLHNSQATLAIELLVAAQAIEWRALAREEPEESEALATGETPSVETTLGARAAAEAQAKRFEALDPREVGELLGDGTGAAYSAIRGAGVDRMVVDRPIDESIRTLRRLVERGQLLDEVNRRLAGSGPSSELRPVLPLAWSRPSG